MREIVAGIELAPPLDDADAVLARLLPEIDVSDELVDNGSGAIVMPRRTGWYGDPAATYTYSGITRVPKSWTPELAALRDRLNARFAIALNSCLVGVYDDGDDRVDWHSDDEPELRDRIISVSLGAERTFVLRAGETSPELPIRLHHGSVLVMTVASQRRWQHAVPAEACAGRRINLTYRVIG